MNHDIRTLASHEAGHAVFVVASPWTEKLNLVQVTPENANEGGRTVLQNHNGECPENEKALEIGKGLAGPLAQLFFYDATIAPAFRERFRANLLKEIVSIQTLNAATVPGWYGDLKTYISILRFPKELGFTEVFFAVERNLRRWIERSNVRNAIERVMTALAERQQLSGAEVRELCCTLEDGDRITNELLLAA
jgi:hypothetical protein